MHDPRRLHFCHRPRPIPSPPLYVRLAIYPPLEITSAQTAPGRSSDRPNPPWNTGMARTMRTLEQWLCPTRKFASTEIRTSARALHVSPSALARRPDACLFSSVTSAILAHRHLSSSQTLSWLPATVVLQKLPPMATGCAPRCATLRIISPSFALHTSRSTSP